MTVSQATTASGARPVLALDAMGVIYASGDDVAELLIPFALGKGSTATPAAIEQAYLEASLGAIDAATFWQRIGLHATLEDEYLDGHRLVDGVADLLGAAASGFGQVCCISNDVAAWSAKLRHRFSLEGRISSWFVSGDLGVRKPDPGIYRHAMKALGVPAQRILFVDDREKNLDAARRLGIGTVLFDPVNASTSSDHPRINRLGELSGLATSLERAGLSG